MRANSAAVLKRDMACEILLSSGSLQLRAQGCSMFPTERRGDVLIVERISLQKIRVGDVVVTVRDSGFISHRVISIGRDAEGVLVITRGDTSVADDLPARESDFIGRVDYVIRKGKLISVPSRLSAIGSMAARIFRCSFPAVRAFMEMRRGWRNRFRTSKESIAQCQS